MADDFQLSKLRSGVPQWNDWVKVNNGLRIDLREAVLRGADLSGANLLRADLSWADLRGAYLRKTNLRETNLQGANLRNADLSGANLLRALLQEADLRGADLRWADLLGVVLRGAIVSSIKSQGGTNDAGTWEFTDLSLSRDITQEQLDSMIGDSGTILPSNLKRPEHWEIIDLVDDVSPPPFVFISYAHQDAEIAEAIERLLQSHGLHTWRDTGLRPGDQWRDEIAKKLDQSFAVLTLWTENSVASDAVREEAELAQKSGKFAHARLDNAKLPYGFGETQYARLAGWDRKTETTDIRLLVEALEGMRDGATNDSIRQRLGQSSTIEFATRNGKIYAGDRPIGAPPAVNDPADLEQRVTTQIQLLEDIDNEIDSIPRNFDVDQLKRRLGQYEQTLRAGLTNWYRPDDNVQGIRNMMIREDAQNSWNDGLVDYLTIMIDRHQQMEPLLHSRQPPEGSEDQIKALPLARLTEDIGDGSDVVRALHEAIFGDEMNEVAEPEVGAEFRSLADDIDEAVKAEEFLPEQQDKKRRWLLGTLSTAAARVGAFVASVSSAVFAGALISTEAGAVLLARFERILDWLTKLFW